MTAYEQEIEALGPWSLTTSRTFWEGFTPSALPAQPTAAAERLRAVFRVEADWSRAQATVTQHGDCAQIVVEGDGDLHAAATQVRRFLSLDVDGRGWPEVAGRDPVIADAQRRLPGLRPCGFDSPYEAAAWSVLSQRVRIAQAARPRNDIIDRHGDDGAGLPSPLGGTLSPESAWSGGRRGGRWGLELTSPGVTGEVADGGVSEFVFDGSGSSAFDAAEGALDALAHLAVGRCAVQSEQRVVALHRAPHVAERDPVGGPGQLPASSRPGPGCHQPAAAQRPEHTADVDGIGPDAARHQLRAHHLRGRSPEQRHDVYRDGELGVRRLGHAPKPSPNRYCVCYG